MLRRHGLLFLAVPSVVQGLTWSDIKLWFTEDCAVPRNETNNFDDALKQSASTSMFSGSSESKPKIVPVECPGKFVEHGIEWINMVAYDWAKSPSLRNITFVTEDTAVGAVGGVLDSNANALARSVGYMALAGKTRLWSFDLHSFDFFCVDRNHKAVDCEIGVLTTRKMSFDNEDIFNMQIGKFTAKGREDRGQPFVLDHDEKSNNLNLVAIGHPEAVWKKHLQGEPSSWNLTSIDDTFDEHGNHITVFVDNFKYATHCNNNKKLPKRPYGDLFRNYVYRMEGSGCDEAVEEEDDD
ncbi:MAG: hypothetical protein M1831_005907 [Alyxoria varia]|nr:MAG: hypothetical protein M1831_005907 [Alyxoria varia]